ncbi:MAG: glycosyl hydrolase family 28 protein [Coriobacteriia bacterium]|nr:glycosyl hydrolase family 28 protein [Coriobacteriia bacterium]
MKLFKDKNSMIIAIVIVAVLLISLGFLLFKCAKNNTTSFNVIDYGAVGNGQADDAKAIQSTIDACNNNGGGQVIFPAGKTFMSSPVELKSNCDIHLEENSKWLANPDTTIYNISAFKENRSEGTKWLWAKDCENLTLSGNGTIDGNCFVFEGAELEDSYELKVPDDRELDPRPHVLTLENVTNLQIKDISLQGAAYWTVHVLGCYNVDVSNIDINNDVKVRNCDGIDIDHSKKVRISDCFIESGDDCICFKNRREYAEYGTCEDIVVNNCIMTSRSCAVKLGSENMDKINDVLINNCVIKASNRGIGIQNRDEGSVTNVRFSNINLDCHSFSEVWWGKGEPIYVTSYPRAPIANVDGSWRFPKGETHGTCGEVRDIYFNNINAISENGCFIGGDTPDKVSNIYFTDVNIKFNRATNYPLGVYDTRPRDGEDLIKSKTYGVYCDKGSNIVFKDFDVKLESNYPKEVYGGLKYGC